MQENIQLIMSVKSPDWGVELKAKPRMHFGAPDASWGGNADYIDEMNKREEIHLVSGEMSDVFFMAVGGGGMFLFLKSSIIFIGVIILIGI